jgi:hypothetical protein
MAIQQLEGRRADEHAGVGRVTHKRTVMILE